MRPDLLIATIISVLLISCNSSDKDTTSNSSTEDSSNAANDSTKPSLTAVSANNSSVSVPFIYGIDISKYQGDEIDFMNKKQDTLSFVICKATEGLTAKDPDFDNNWKTIFEKGFTRGAYHFYHCADDPIKQVSHFLSVIGTLSPKDFPPIVDFEEQSIDKTCSPTQIQSNLLAFLKQLAQKTGRTPIIYTDFNTGERYLNNAAFENYPLFIAEYRNVVEPTLPGVWKNKKWILWQKSESYVTHSTTDDFDIFNGGIDELNRFLNNNQ